MICFYYKLSSFTTSVSVEWIESSYDIYFPQNDLPNNLSNFVTLLSNHLVFRHENTCAARKIDSYERSRGQDDRCRHSLSFQAGFMKRGAPLVQFSERGRVAPKPAEYRLRIIAGVSRVSALTHPVPRAVCHPRLFFLPLLLTPQVSLTSSVGARLLSTRRDVRIRTLSPPSGSSLSLSLLLSPFSLPPPFPIIEPG